MKRESLVFFLGLAIVLMPFLGIPSMWKRIVYIVLGFVLAIIGYQLRRLAYTRSIEDHTGERKTDVYAEQVAVPVDPSLSFGAHERHEEIQEIQKMSEAKPLRTRIKDRTKKT